MLTAFSLLIQNQPDPMQCNVGCGAGYVNDQVPKGALEMVSSMKEEKELYLGFEEVNYRRSCYVFRTIKLSELLQCSCHFSIETCEITKCKHCAPKIKLESQWRLRAWLHTGEKVRESCGAKETNIPDGMICCSYGSQIIFAGGLGKMGKHQSGLPLCLVDRSGVLIRRLQFGKSLIGVSRGCILIP